MPNKKQLETAKLFMQRAEPLMAKLREANNPEIATMERDDMELAIVNCINSRNGR